MSIVPSFFKTEPEIECICLFFCLLFIFFTILYIIYAIVALLASKYHSSQALEWTHMIQIVSSQESCLELQLSTTKLSSKRTQHIHFMNLLNLFYFDQCDRRHLQNPSSQYSTFCLRSIDFMFQMKMFGTWAAPSMTSALRATYMGCQKLHHSSMHDSKRVFSSRIGSSSISRRAWFYLR